MSKLSNKDDFKDKPEVYSLLTELEAACYSSDLLAQVKVQVLINKLKKHNISFKAQENGE